VKNKERRAEKKGTSPLIWYKEAFCDCFNPDLFLLPLLHKSKTWAEAHICKTVNRHVWTMF